MSNIDELLQDFGQGPVPELAWLDDAVMRRLSERQGEARVTSGLLSTAAIVALGIGYVGGSIMPSPAAAAEPRLVIAETALAPSTLLDFL